MNIIAVFSKTLENDAILSFIGDFYHTRADVDHSHSTDILPFAHHSSWRQRSLRSCTTSRWF